MHPVLKGYLLMFSSWGCVEIAHLLHSLFIDCLALVLGIAALCYFVAGIFDLLKGKWNAK